MMTYKEALFFVAKCLTISLEEKNKQEIELQLQNDEVDWEAVVKVSTSHYVLPAMYCNLKRADFLHYLPEDLVEFMQHITDLNRERNEQIIEQAKEINQLLLDNNITPIFLKGTGNLLEELYEDHAERMVGDIDFIVDKKFYYKTFNVLRKNNYVTVIDSEYHFNQFCHQPSLKKKNKIAAVEIHKELLKEKYADEFNYLLVSKNLIKSKNINFMSYGNQLSISMIATQINDDAVYFKTISLRNAYDVYLLSKKTNSLETIVKFDKLFNPLNNFLAICNIVFGNLSSIKFQENKETKKYTTAFKKSINRSNQAKIKSRMINKFLSIRIRLNIIKNAFSNKKTRAWLLKRITDKNWQNHKLIQLGLKKPKSNS